METPRLTRAECRELDRRAIEEAGVPSLLLMENAGRAVAAVVERHLGGAGGTVGVLCGPGNNGGDGYVIARTLWNRGHAVRVWHAGSSSGFAGLSGDAARMRALWEGAGGEVGVVHDDPGVRRLLVTLSGCALVVDALFGTGLTRELRAPYPELIEGLAMGETPVLAVDLPSGLDADEGSALGAVVRARATVTFVAEKVGFAKALGPACVGEVVVAEIGIPRPLLVEFGLAVALPTS